jgi:hypothetical protein
MVRPRVAHKFTIIISCQPVYDELLLEVNDVFYADGYFKIDLFKIHLAIHHEIEFLG